MLQMLQLLIFHDRLFYILRSKIVYPVYLQRGIYKAKDQAHHIFFTLRVQKDSLAMQLIKSCPIRHWDQNLKVWLVPYSQDNWKILQQKIGTLPYTIEKEVLIIPTTIQPFIPYQKKSSSFVPKEIKPKTILSIDHQNALLKMKEQLVVKRYQPSTHKSYLACMTEFLTYYNNKKAAEIDMEDIKAFMLFKINHDKISENTQNGLINAIYPVGFLRKFLSLFFK